MNVEIKSIHGKQVPMLLKILENIKIIKFR